MSSESCFPLLKVRVLYLRLKFFVKVSLCWDSLNLVRYIVVAGADSGFMMFAMVWMMMAFVMYMLRPQSMRGGDNSSKPQGISTYTTISRF